MECCNIRKVHLTGLVRGCSTMVSCYRSCCASCWVELPQKQTPREGLDNSLLQETLGRGAYGGGGKVRQERGERAQRVH